jgi:hypothetical protein
MSLQHVVITSFPDRYEERTQELEVQGGGQEQVCREGEGKEGKNFGRGKIFSSKVGNALSNRAEFLILG